MLSRCSATERPKSQHRRGCERTRVPPPGMSYRDTCLGKPSGKGGFQQVVVMFKSRRMVLSIARKEEGSDEAQFDVTLQERDELDLI